MYISLVDPEELPTTVRASWDAASPGGKKFVQAIANAPEHASRLLLYYNGLRFGTKLGPRLCELLRLAIAQTTRCPLCLEGRLDAAFEEGLTEDEIRGLEDNGGADLSPRDRSVVDFALKFGNDHFSIGEDDYRRMYEHFSEEEVAEIGMLCAQFLGFGRLVMTLGLEQPSCPIPGVGAAAR